MNLPKWLWAIIIVSFISGLVGLGFRIFSECLILEDIASLALIFTLVVVAIYVYYTYMIAKDAWTPSASFVLEVYPGDPYHFAFFLQNHSKVSLKCWCNLNITVYGKNVSLGGFYSGETSFDLQPFGPAHGHFSIKDILIQTNYDLQSMKQKASPDNLKKQLCLNIDFWYSPVNEDRKIYNPRQPYYFDFARDVIVLDF